jgi:hypothetical protein
MIIVSSSTHVPIHLMMNDDEIQQQEQPESSHASVMISLIGILSLDEVSPTYRA